GQLLASAAWDEGVSKLRTWSADEYWMNRLRQVVSAGKARASGTKVRRRHCLLSTFRLARSPARRPSHMARARGLSAASKAQVAQTEIWTTPPDLRAGNRRALGVGTKMRTAGPP